MGSLLRVWNAPPADLSLLDGEVHVWRSQLDCSNQALQQFTRLLSLDELARAERFRFQQHRDRFITGRGILRTLMGRYLQIAPEQVQFCYGHRGKPALAPPCNDPSLSFNLAHSQSLALYALTRDRPIGIDLEYLRSIGNLTQLAQRFFSPAEWDAIASLGSEPEQQRAFFRHWVCKEAYLKATGEGLAQLEQVAVAFTPDASGALAGLHLSDRASSMPWLLQEFEPDENCVAAVAIARETAPIKCWQFSAPIE